MTQGLIAGGTNYSEQSIKDIQKDIEFWISLCKENKTLFEKTIAELKDKNYWDEKVATNFQAFCYSVPKVCDMFCSDFQTILSAIDEDQITKREISLMKNIYKVSCDNEEYSWRSFNGEDDGGRWHDYGNPLFQKVEKLYGEGRDFFATLLDASNAACRMEDYMKEEKTVVNNSVYTDNSITVGSGAKIQSSILGHSNIIEKPQKKSSFWKKFWLPLVITVVGGVLVTAICIWLGFK